MHFSPPPRRPAAQSRPRQSESENRPWRRRQARPPPRGSHDRRRGRHSPRPTSARTGTLRAHRKSRERELSSLILRGAAAAAAAAAHCQCRPSSMRDHRGEEQFSCSRETSRSTARCEVIRGWLGCAQCRLVSTPLICEIQIVQLLCAHRAQPRVQDERGAS